MEGKKRHRVEFLTSAFKINNSIGSKQRIEWLTLLNEAQNDDVFLSNISLLVDFMWDQDYHLVLIDGVVHLAYAILLTIDAMFLDHNRNSKYATLGITFFLSLKEFYQMYINGIINYVMDYYNFMDIFGEFLYCVYALNYLLSEDGHDNAKVEYAHIIGLFCIYLRTISQLRIF